MSSTKVQKQKQPSSAVGLGEPVDLTSYNGVDTEGEFFVPFWDQELYGRDVTGKKVRIGVDDGEANGWRVNPLYSPNPWDKVQLGDYVLPGLWEATATPSLQLDIQKPQGFDGAAIITRGYKPAGITLTGSIWTPLQWHSMQEIYPAIWTRPFKVSAQDQVTEKHGKIGQAQKDLGKIVGKQRALDIVNPGINFLGIVSLVIEKITPPQLTDQPGVRKIIIQCVEYVPEPMLKESAQKKASGTQTRGNGNAFSDKIKDVRKPAAPSGTARAVNP